MSSLPSKAGRARSVVSNQPKESLYISTTSTAGTFEAYSVHTATHVWSDDSNATTSHKISQTIFGVPRLAKLFEEMLSLLVDLSNGDNPVNVPADDWLAKQGITITPDGGVRYENGPPWEKLPKVGVDRCPGQQRGLCDGRKCSVCV